MVAALRYASGELAPDALGKPLCDAVPLAEIPVYDFGRRKSGPFERYAW